METELEVLDSADDVEAQDGLSADEDDSSQEDPSEADDDSSQDSDDIAALRTELAEARQAIEDAKTQIGVLQSNKDKEVRAAEARYQSLVQRLGAQRSREERQRLRERATRAQQDPEEAEALANDLLANLDRTEADEEWAKKLQGASQETLQQTYLKLYNSPKLGLTAEERRLAEERAMAEPEGLSIEGFAHHAAAIKEEKASAELKTIKEALAALKGAKAGAALKAAGGPERPVNGGSGPGSTYSERLRRGDNLTPEEVDRLVAERFK